MASCRFADGGPPMRRDHASEVVPLQPPGNEHRVSWAVRNALWLIGITPLIPQVVGSAANIWHNVIHIKPLLSDAQHAVFLSTITTFNSAVYPTPPACVGLGHPFAAGFLHAIASWAAGRVRSPPPGSATGHQSALVGNRPERSLGSP